MNRFVVCGQGSIGRRHLRNLRTLVPDAEIAVWRQHTLVEPDAVPPAGADRFVRSLDEALEFHPDAVLIAGPAPAHVPTGLAFARAGVHLFMEKPLSTSLDGIDELLATCSRNRVTLLVAYCMRFLHPLQTMRRMIHGGAVGRPLSALVEAGQYLPDWRHPADYRTGVTAQAHLGGGALLELSHEIDYARWLLGEVEEVTACVDRLSDLEIDVEDVAKIILRMRGQDGKPGPLVSLHLDLLQRHANLACRIIGTEATIEADLMLGTLRIARAGENGWQPVPCQQDPDGNTVYLRQFTHFLDCCRTGEDPLVTGADGRRVMEIVLAAKSSSATGRRIALPSAGEIDRRWVA